MTCDLEKVSNWADYVGYEVGYFLLLSRSLYWTQLKAFFLEFGSGQGEEKTCLLKEELFL